MKERIAFGLCLALLFVWSLPGTVALRTLLLLAALALLANRIASADFRDGLRSARVPLAWLAGFVLWLLLQALFVSAETGWALGELRGQWLPALLALLLGLLLARGEAGLAATGITLVFGSQAAIAVAIVAWHWLIGSGQPAYAMPLTGGKLEMSFVLNLLLAFLTIDLFCRATRRTPLLRLRGAAVIALGVLALACSYLAGARNGILGVIFLSFSATSLFVFDQRRHLGPFRTAAVAGAIVAALAAFATVHYRSDSRWQAFAETAVIAWDIDRHTTWLNQVAQPWPKLADGRNVDLSAYIRIAFISAGTHLVAEHPLGHGYGRNAFVHALRKQHPEAQVGHAHSGWIDLGVGGGVPALLLWAAFIAGLIWRGWRSFFDDNNACGLLLFFLATGYAGRMALDSVNKDHMLQMFLFLAGLLLVLTTPPRKAAGA